MSIPPLPLAFIGWFFALLSFAALVLGALLLQHGARGGKVPRRDLQPQLAGDLALLAIWAIGLVSAFGLLNGLSWARTGLEYFCWVLIALTLFSASSRLIEHARRVPDAKSGLRSWTLAIAGVLLVALPLVALCAASIATLRSDATRLQFEQRR